MSWLDYVPVGVAVAGGAAVAAVSYVWSTQYQLPELEVDIRDKDALKRFLFDAIISKDHAQLDVGLKWAKRMLAKSPSSLNYASIDDVATSQKQGNLLCFACRFGRIECAKVLLKHGIRMDATDAKKEQAIHAAARNGNAELLQLLIDHKADLTAKNYDGWTALHWTATNGRTEATRVLLEHGAIPSALSTGQNRSPLHYAVQNGHVLDATLLVSSGCNVSTCDTEGNTPMHAAARNGSVALFHLLILNDAVIVERNCSGMTPLQVAVSRGHSDFVIAMLQHDPQARMLELIEAIETMPTKDDFAPQPEDAAVEEDNAVPAVPPQAFDDQKLAARLEAMRKLLEKLIFEGDFGEPLLNFLTERVLSRGLRYLQANTGKTAAEDLSAVRNGIQQVVWMMEFMEKVNLQMAQSVVPDVVKHLDGLWMALDERLDDLGQAGRKVDQETAAQVGPIIQAYYILAKQIGGTMVKSELNARIALEHSFLDFIDRHMATMRAVLSYFPQLLVGSFDFILENIDRPEWKVADLVKLLSFDELLTWFRTKLVWQQAHFKEENVVVVVPRGTMMQESCSSLLVGSGDLFKGQFNVKFDGESGVGAGVRREWFQVIAEEMFDENYALFVQAPDGTMQPNPASSVNPDHLSYFTFVGRVIALAIYHGELLRVSFTRPFFKLLLGRPIELDDLESVDPVQYKNLRWLLDNDVDDLEMTFSAELNVFGSMEVVDLVPDGREVDVTNANKAEYVRLLTEQRMYTSIEEQVRAFKRGFFDIVPSYVGVFDEFQLELLISGLPDVDIEDWQSHTKYNEYSSEDAVVQWFWEEVRDMTSEEQAQLLQFATGTSSVPIGGFKNLKGAQGPSPFTLTKASKRGDDTLPTASTCFNLLSLPAYTSKTILAERLRAALSFGSRGFEFS